MAGAGYPGVFPGGLSTGDTNIGAVGKSRSGALGYPGVFPGGLSTGSATIGAVQKAAGAVASQIKTWNTIAIANVKTRNGVAIANIKTVNGVSNV